MDVDGVACIISDTAGLRLGEDKTTDVIELEGMTRARYLSLKYIPEYSMRVISHTVRREAFRTAQVKVLVHDSSIPFTANEADVSVLMKFICSKSTLS